MSKLVLLYLTFVVGLIFLILPNGTQPKDFFPFYDIDLYLSTYVYFILEKSILILLAGMIYNESIEYRDELRIFVWLLIFDLADYFLTYNTTWFHIGEFPISMNIVKCIIFGGCILYIWIWEILNGKR